MIKNLFPNADLPLVKYIHNKHRIRIKSVLSEALTERVLVTKSVNVLVSYTTNSAEMQTAVAVLGYHQEGDAAQIHPEQTPITIPLYRLYNPTAFDHFYTTSASERDNAAAHLGYVEEGITGYVYETPLCGTVPLYRMYSAGATDHFYTTNAEEKDNAVANLGYTYEGIAAYVNPQA